MSRLRSRSSGWGSTADEVKADLLSALLNLGYNRAVADKAVDAVLKKSPQANFEALLRDVLRGMMKS